MGREDGGAEYRSLLLEEEEDLSDTAGDGIAHGGYELAFASLLY